MFSAPKIACNRSNGNRHIIPDSGCSSPGVPGVTDGTLKTSSFGDDDLTSGPDSKSAAEDSDDEDEDDDDNDDRLSFRIEVKRVDVLLFDGGWCCCRFEVGVVAPFAGVELACGDCP